MKEKTKPNKCPKKENKNHPENLSANLDEIKEEFKTFSKVGRYKGTYFFASK